MISNSHFPNMWSIWWVIAPICSTFIGFGVLQLGLAIAEFDALTKETNDDAWSYVCVLAFYNFFMALLYFQNRLTRNIFKLLFKPCFGFSSIQICAEVNLEILLILFVPPALIRIPTLLDMADRSTMSDMLFVEKVVFCICTSMASIPVIWKIGWTFFCEFGHDKV